MEWPDTGQQEEGGRQPESSSCAGSWRGPGSGCWELPLFHLAHGMLPLGEAQTPVASGQEVAWGWTQAILLTLSTGPVTSPSLFLYNKGNI